MRKRIVLLTITITMLSLMAATFVGCGKKKDKESSKQMESQSEEKQEKSKKKKSGKDKNAEKEQSKDITTDGQITKDNICNLRASVVSVGRYAEDELNHYVTGYMNMDYVEIDEESRGLCPALAKSLERFNDSRKQELNEHYPRFVEASNTYAEKIYESGYSEDVEAYVEDTCVDYDFVDVMRADNAAMSILTTHVDFWGTDEPTRMFVGTTFDSQTGAELDIKDVVADWDGYKAAIAKEFEQKYGKVNKEDIDPTDYLGWVLTPEGVIVYYPDAYINAAGTSGAGYAVNDGRDKTIQINFNEYPGVLNEKYNVAPDEYAIPFDIDDVFYIDIAGDRQRDAVTFSPMGPNDYDQADEYPTYEIFVNGKPYSDFEEDWFYGVKTYYVHKRDGSYIYAYTEGYEHDFISVNKFIGQEPVCIAKLPATPFEADNFDDSDEELIYRRIAFSNPAMVHDALSFDKNVCGTYKSDEGDGWEVRHWDIRNIDGRYYLDYIGEYDYAAAEIELLDENPYVSGDELRYMVRVYPFSGFAFGGEYQGEGYTMYISSKLGVPEKRIELSDDNPFFYELQTMYGAGDVNLHEIQNQCVANRVAPEIMGAWRAKAADGPKETEVFIQFSEDGRVDIVRKREDYTPMVYRGIYNLEKKGSKFVGTIEAEAMGMGSQPMAEWILEFDPSAENPIKISDEYEDGSPFVNGADNMKFYKSESGKHDRFIHPGPYDREAEVADMWYEYNSYDEEFMYDFSPEYVDAIHDYAMDLAGGTSYISYGIQDNRNGGVIWIKILDDVLPSVQVTKNWVRYDMGSGEYCDIQGYYLDEKRRRCQN